VHAHPYRGGQRKGASRGRPRGRRARLLRRLSAPRKGETYAVPRGNILQLSLFFSLSFSLFFFGGGGGPFGVFFFFSLNALTRSLLAVPLA